MYTNVHRVALYRNPGYEVIQGCGGEEGDGGIILCCLFTFNTTNNILLMTSHPYASPMYVCMYTWCHCPLASKGQQSVMFCVWQYVMVPLCGFLHVQGVGNGDTFSGQRMSTVCVCVCVADSPYEADSLCGV